MQSTKRKHMGPQICKGDGNGNNDEDGNSGTIEIEPEVFLGSMERKIAILKKVNNWKNLAVKQN